MLKESQSEEVIVRSKRIALSWMYRDPDAACHNNDWEPYIETINGVEMALVPAGCFMMGSEEGHGTGGESPMHKICFEEPFWLDVYEVTQAQFAEFGGEAGQESCFSGDNHLSGNVWEWDGDWYGKCYFGTLEDGVVNPQGPESGTVRALRGGSWMTRSVARRVSIRYNDFPDNSTFTIGFRCALSFQP